MSAGQTDHAPCVASALCVVHAAERSFRTACDALLRAAGVRVRLTSRHAELNKALRSGDVALIIVDASDADVQSVLAVQATSAERVSVMHRAPDESIEEIVVRALEKLLPTKGSPPPG